MAFRSALALGAMLMHAGTAFGTPIDEIFGRSVGDSCSAPEGTGSCQATSACKGISYSQALCPNDPDDVQCCVEIACHVDGGSGYCRSQANGCPNGSFHAGSSAPYPCPGSDDIQCCIAGGAPPAPTPTPTPSPSPPAGSSVGAKILAQAETAAGLPYAYGGGSCSGPSADIPPYQYGDTGFDCSGLVCWALCQVTGRDLFTEGLRVTHDMYCADESQLKYKKYPYAERQAGDAVFFGNACDCDADGSIHHVGLMMDSGDRLFNAPDDQINVIEELPISGFSQTPCPYVIRFTE